MATPSGTARRANVDTILNSPFSIFNYQLFPDTKIPEYVIQYFIVRNDADDVF